MPEDWSGDGKDRIGVGKGGCSGVEWVDSSVVLCSCMLTLPLSSEMLTKSVRCAGKCMRCLRQYLYSVECCTSPLFASQVDRTIPGSALLDPWESNVRFGVT